jgi:hypothetical protein
VLNVVSTLAINFDIKKENMSVKNFLKLTKQNENMQVFYTLCTLIFVVELMELPTELCETEHKNDTIFTK